MSEEMQFINFILICLFTIPPACWAFYRILKEDEEWQKEHEEPRHDH